jgi:fatty-acyl-CoA synthase
VKDAVRAGGKIQTRLLGEGELPIAESMRVLCDGGYDGWICFEGEKRWDADAAEPEVSVPQFAEYMRGVFATIES